VPLDALRKVRIAARAEGILLTDEDLSPVVSAMEKKVGDPRFEGKVHYEVDPSLERGACRVETGTGRIVHDPREVLERMIEGLRERMT